MAVQQKTNLAYGLTQALIPTYPNPIVANRAPGTTDFAQLATVWIIPSTNTAYLLTSVANNVATWVAITNAGGPAVFTSLTVTPGPIALTGTTTINAAGAAATTIGTGGTGAVNIGNATGNTNVTGSLTTTTALVAGTSVSAGTTMTAAGDIRSTGGDFIATVGDLTLNAGIVDLVGANSRIQFLAGPLILGGIGVPVAAHPKGSLYLRSDGTGVNDRAYIATDGVGGWTAIVTVA